MIQKKRTFNENSGIFLLMMRGVLQRLPPRALASCSGLCGGLSLTSFCVVLSGGDNDFEGHPRLPVILRRANGRVWVPSLTTTPLATTFQMQSSQGAPRGVAAAANGHRTPAVLPRGHKPKRVCGLLRTRICLLRNCLVWCRGRIGGTNPQLLAAATVCLLPHRSS